MADADQAQGLKPDECREPTLEDLAKLCRALNLADAHYLVVGGFAVRAAGFVRNTMDVDLLVDASLENEGRVFEALRSLPDKAVNQLEPGDVAKFIVVRVADEILVDLMKSGCGVDYAEAIKDAVYHDVDGVRIPFASPMTLWRMKQTKREKDIPDRLFLRKLLEAQGVQFDPAPAAAIPEQRVADWIERKLGEKN